MKSFLDKISTPVLAIVALFLAFAPFMQEPHLWSKLNMLFAFELSKPIDIFDLFMHGTPLTLLLIKFFYFLQDKQQNKP